MGVSTFPLVGGAQTPAGGDASAKTELGAIYAIKDSSANGNWSLIEYVLLDNNGCSQGEVLVQNLATIPSRSYMVAKAATSDDGAPIKGIAMATIASNKYGYMYIGGHVPVADLSQSVVTGEYLKISGSTAGKLTNDKASVFNAGTQGSSSMFMVVGIAKTTFATGTGSIQLLGVWG